MMGKDRNKKSIVARIPSLTKDGKKHDNVKLSRELDGIRKQYRDAYSIVVQLADQYQRSKANLMSTRYGQLKRMIKNATTDDVLDRCLPPSEHEQKKREAVTGLLKSAKAFAGEHSSSSHQASGGKASGISGQRQQSGKSGNLLQACRHFAGAADEANPTRDLDDMSKKEVSADNKEKKHHIVKYDTKFLRLRNRLEKLKRDYEDSKEHAFVQRYSLMKDMIKIVIHDEVLQPD